MSTNPPEKLQHFPGLTESKLNEQAGVFSGKVDNGDVILAKFGLCELSLRGHLLTTETDETALLKKAQSLLAAIKPAGQPDTSFEKAIKALNIENLKTAVTLSGEFDQHEVIIKASSSTLFQWEIHYKWLPPEH